MRGIDAHERGDGGSGSEDEGKRGIYRPPVQ